MKGVSFTCDLPMHLQIITFLTKELFGRGSYNFKSGLFYCNLDFVSGYLLIFLEISVLCTYDLYILCSYYDINHVSNYLNIEVISRTIQNTKMNPVNLMEPFLFDYSLKKISLESTIFIKKWIPRKETVPFGNSTVYIYFLFTYYIYYLCIYTVVTSSHTKHTFYHYYYY